MVERKEKLRITVEAVLLCASVGGAALASRESQWDPVPLVVLLLVLSLAGQHLSIKIRGQLLTSSFVATVLAMTLLGPAPAVAFTLLGTAIYSVRRRQSIADWILNMAIQATYPLAGGLLAIYFVSHGKQGVTQSTSVTVTFGLAVFGVFAVTNVFNFLMVAFGRRVILGEGLWKQVTYLFVPMLPSQVATGALTAILAMAYTKFGYPVLLGLVLVLAIFQYLAAALVKSEERADQLEARSIRLASLQLGVLVTLVETLALRDRAAARHAAAVARLSRELAQELGCDEGNQDIVHSAGLLHDIGKFALPDRLLHAQDMNEDDRRVIRRHPQEGATLVGRLDGYGPVADVILYHHEHVDGTGYPAGLIGSEIPTLSRVLAIANRYDSLTARNSAGPTMTPMDAIAQLRFEAGRQLDADMVECFIAKLERNGPVIFAEGDDADFEAELAFERRARMIAQPAIR